MGVGAHLCPTYVQFQIATHLTHKLVASHLAPVGILRQMLPPKGNNRDILYQAKTKVSYELISYDSNRVLRLFGTTGRPEERNDTPKVTFMLKTKRKKGIMLDCPSCH